MELTDKLKKIRALEIKTRRLVNSTFSGGYHSIFKGKGISFAEVRDYYPGDDVRLIDWNVTARMNSPYIKLFEEERELTVLLMIDISGSGEFGSGSRSKIDLAAEIAAILGFSANKNNDRVGLILFSNEVERFIPPKKGKNHMFRLLRDIFYFKPKSKETSISKALEFLLNTQKQRAIVFIVSDFIDHHYDHLMRIAAKKHDLVPIVIEDPREKELLDLGELVLEDEETGEVLIVNSKSTHFQEAFKNIVYQQQLEKERFFKSINTTPIWISTDGSIMEGLIQYFKSRFSGKSK